ncbi:uncharacterized protein TRIVIDRAFT_209187 [Trichoderma virens Gv29-8]|uniref:Uncharacterized protein n=1 Tax=Hypocrea virens (strain Gv29-8 / FGSC 10586) TaxID=413071 RepID=G9MR31_HYPVG|nr:uncharacterized protein TRIVIDRAFT_209187 [Trichoderma virens Gv29-8]EHK22558.1 hypothetical protein TRIVIDRAFT_209187 [Trichoderma virens Gv29-8]UKZ47602.1 hypothetical protein TrVGV298_001825 [Trichoderma virens]
MDSSTPTEDKKVSFSLPVIKPGESPLTESELRRILPALFRNGTAWLGSPHKRVHYFLQDDLNIEKLTEVSSYFSILGKVTPPRPIHHHQALGLEIVVTEKMDTHLLWTKGKIFIKPFPRYLMEPEFWRQFIACPEACPYASDFHIIRSSGLVRRRLQLSEVKPCEHSKLWKCAMGFVYSYFALIAHESDFRIAKSCKLLPEELEFDDWKGFVDRMLSSGRIYGQADERFTYGELNMARLNKLLMFQQPVRYFFQPGDSYGFLRDNSSLVPSASLHVGAVLASMQVRPLVAKFRGRKALALVISLGCLLALYSLLFIGGKGLPTLDLEE